LVEQKDRQPSQKRSSTHAVGHAPQPRHPAALAERVRPKLITIGSSLNLLPHPVAAIRAIADQVGARVLFDAAHVCGLIAGGVWPNPLAEGAQLMTMSTYKSLGGPPGGLVVTHDADLAQRIDKIASRDEQERHPHVCGDSALMDAAGLRQALASVRLNHPIVFRAARSKRVCRIESLAASPRAR
jgi:selenocysteine lyase/cysteine desulfurase